MSRVCIYEQRVCTLSVCSYRYVKVYLLPDKSKAGKRKTRVKKHTMNPIFDEVLKYSVSLEELNSRTLWLSVWHSDMFGRNNFLGEVRLPLENKIFDDPSPKFYPLQERVSMDCTRIAVRTVVPNLQGVRVNESAGEVRIVITGYI